MQTIPNDQQSILHGKRFLFIPGQYANDRTNPGSRITKMFDQAQRVANRDNGLVVDAWLLILKDLLGQMCYIRQTVTA